MKVGEEVHRLSSGVTHVRRQRRRIRAPTRYIALTTPRSGSPPANCPSHFLDHVHGQGHLPQRNTKVYISRFLSLPFVRTVT